MRTDIYGQQIYDEMELCLLYLQDPSRNLKRVFVNDEIKFDEVLQLENTPELIKYTGDNCSINQFDERNQSHWLMPVEYYELDIAQYILDQCSTDEELQRAGQGFILFLLGIHKINSLYYDLSIDEFIK